MTLIAITVALVLFLGPLLLYTLAFNLTFLIQELFLVLPKALIPGVRCSCSAAHPAPPRFGCSSSRRRL